MGALHDFEPEKLIVGVIYHDPSVYEAAMKQLVDAFGEIDDMTEEFSFSGEFSTYYDEEIGGEGLRRIYSFKTLVDPTKQAQIKTLTNEMEKSFSTPDGKRLINIDPGFVNTGRVMLATTKMIGFRIPLSDGICTEMTLFWARGAWHSLPWTYRDYQSEKVQNFLTRVRKTYLKQRKTPN